MRCVAVIAVRNGLDYARKCIQHLNNNNIEVAIIDQSSDDGTYDICKEFLNNGVCEIRRIDYPGFFSLEDQLIQKFRLIEKLKTDWVIHQDIDENLESPLVNNNLKDSISAEDAKGYNVINFNEFVFLPYDNNISFYKSPFYYFFEPFPSRLMRAWKKSASLSSIESGGHKLKGNIKLSPLNHNLLHYIFSSQDNAYNKYQNRVFTKFETDKGWHRNRLKIDIERLTFPDKKQMEIRTFNELYNFNTSNPWKKHYWEI